MKKMVLAAAISLALVFTLAVGNAFATPVTWKFSFTGADLLNNVFADGIDGSNAVDNNLFDGARLLRVGTNANHADAARTYVESQHDTFNERWDEYADEGYVFDAFNLWGLDGRGQFWGEDYKPESWVSHSGPANWSTGYHTWPWGNPPAGAFTLDFPWWSAGQNGLGMTATNLNESVFSFRVKFDYSDMFWGGNVGDAPNALPVLTFWFGGFLTKYDEQGNIFNDHMYEGNMVLTGSQVVPEPGTIALLGLGLAGLGFYGYRRRNKV